MPHTHKSLLQFVHGQGDLRDAVQTSASPLNHHWQPPVEFEEKQLQLDQELPRRSLMSISNIVFAKRESTYCVRKHSV